MRCIRGAILFLLLFLSPLLRGQDSLALSQHLPAHSIKPAFDFDQRFSFISAKQVNIWGARAGLLVNERFKTGVGAYFLNDKLKTLTTAGGTARRNLYFGTGYFEPFIFRSTYVELSVPFEAGFGKSLYRTYDASGETDSTVRTSFIPTGAGLSLSFKLPPIGRFKPTRWIGINFLAGYRYCLLENYFQTDYNGAFWSISGAIFLDRVTDDCKAWQQQHKARKAAAGS